MDRTNIAIVLGVICAALVAITMLYALITTVFAEINPVAAVAAISVGIVGIAWFRKTSFNK